MDQEATRRFQMRPLATTAVVFMTGLALLGGLLPAIHPLLHGHLPWVADGLLHLHRLAQLERSVTHGLLYPRWLPDMGFGFGFPLFNYYAPLSYYLILPARFLGLSVEASLQFGYALALLSLAAGVYLWARDMFGKEAGLVAAFSIGYAPYILFDVHHRGVLPEIWGLAWLSLTFWAIYRLACRPGPLPFALVVLFYAALLLTHNILALVGTPLLMGYALFLIGLYGRLKSGAPLTNPTNQRLTNVVTKGAVPAALALGLGVAAFFWLPAFAEKELVQIHQLYAPANFYYGNHFLSLNELAAAPQPADSALINPVMAFSHGWPQLLLALLFWLPGGRSLTFSQRAHRLALTLALLALSLMLLPISLPLWDHLPLIRFVQFPWRFLGPTSLILAVMAGAAVTRLPGRPSLWPPLLLVILALFGLFWLFPGRYPAQSDPTPIDLIRFEAQTGALGTTSAADYLPVAVHELPPAATLLPLYEAAGSDYIIPRLDASSLPASASIIEAQYDLTEAWLTIHTDEPFRARFHWYYFPGWQVRLNGSLHPAGPDGPHGLLTTEIPNGRHELHLRFGATPLRQVAWGISLASLALFAAAIISLYHGAWGVRRQFLRPTPHARPSPHLQKAYLPLALCALIGLSLFAVKGLYLDRHSNLFHRILFDGRHVQGVSNPLQLNFGGQMALIGYDLQPAPTAADEPVEVTLYWRAMLPLERDYSVGVHLLDDQGRLYGQQDRQHPGGYPTSRWPGTEYARDRLQLTVQPGAPPGQYYLAIYVYEAGSGRRLELLNEAGQPLGVTYQLAAVQITQPHHLPTPETIPMGRRLDGDLANSLRLLGVDMPPATVLAGQSLPLTFYWQATHAPDDNYTARLRLLTAADQSVAQMVWSPGRDSYPTSTWPPGDIVRDGRAFLVPAGRLDDPGQPVESGTYSLRLDLLDSNGRVQPLSIHLAEIRVEAPLRNFTAPLPEYALNANLGRVATLVGYDLSAPTLSPGHNLHLTLHWQAAALTEISYVAFIHLVGPDGRIYAQQDRVPAAGQRPTTGWFTGEFIEDAVTLALDPATPPGNYQLLVGLYDPDSGRRLDHYEADQIMGDAILLPTTIEAPTGQ